MQPYQKASEEIIRQSQEPGNLLLSLSKTATGIAGGGYLAKRISPLLDKLIPSNLAVKGLEKIDPRFGKFIKGALENGNTIDETLDFLRNKNDSETQLSPSGFPIKNKEQETKSKSEKPKEEGNIVKKYSDKLHAFIEKEINGGRPVLETGAIARLNKDFEKTIKKMEKDYETNWSDILLNTYQDVYGNLNKQAPQQPQPQQPIAGTQAPQQPQQPQGQMGAGQQALMQAIQRLQQIRGGGAR